MKRLSKWLWGIGCAVLIALLIFNWAGERSVHGFTLNAQGSLMLGWSLIRQAESNIHNGDKIGTSPYLYQGIGYLNASDGGMRQVGVHGVMGIAMFLERAISCQFQTAPSEITDSTKKHYLKVIQVFIDAFKPFDNINCGDIKNRQLQEAIDKIYQAMTPQERQDYQGWSSSF